MTRDEVIEARWPAVFHLLDPHGLVATWIPAEDDQVDDCIEVRLDGCEEDLGDLQLTLDGTWIANVWTDARQEARAHAVARRDVSDATKDLIGLLERHNRIAAQ